MAAILVFDPDSQVCAFLKNELTRMGHQPIFSKDGYSVIPMMEQHQPKAVILDYQLPAAAGAEILQRIRATATGAELPVIFVSTTPKYEIQFNVMDSPTVGYVDKPITVEQLKAVMGELLGQGATQAPPPKYVPPDPDDQTGPVVIDLD